MSLIVVGSAKGSPGATTLALAMAGSLARREGARYPGALLLDADHDGGDVALRLGIDPVPSVATLALEGRHGFDEALCLQHAQRARALPGVAVLAGVAGRAQAAVLDWLAEPLLDLARRSALPIIVDGGRLGHLAVRALACGADHVVLACGPATSDLLHTRSALALFADEGVEPEVVVMSNATVGAQAVADALGRRVAAIVPPSARPGDPVVARLLSVVAGEQPAVAEPVRLITEAAPVGALAAALRAVKRTP